MPIDSRIPESYKTPKERRIQFELGNLIMKKHYPFPSINQFRHSIRDLKNRACYVGKDDNGDPVYDWSKPLSKIEFEGTVKLHGTNAAIVYDTKSCEIYAQSREHVITPEKDNAGFARWTEENKSKIKEIFAKLVSCWPDATPNKYVLFGEWCGKGVFSNVAIGQLPKMFVIFGMQAVYHMESEDITEWWNCESSHLACPEINIFNISSVPVYQVTIDLAYPEACLAEIEKFTTQVGDECPFAKSMGVSGIGEGIVWKPAHDSSYRFAFKTKDERHSASKIKKLPTVDIEKLNGVKAFVIKHVHEDRLEQAYAATCSDPATAGMEQVGSFLRWLNQDVWKEESDEAIANNITQKEIGGEISKVAVRWFREKLNSSL